MPSFAIGALLVSVVAGALGFTGIAKGAAAVSKVVFGVFLVLALLLFGLLALGISLL